MGLGEINIVLVPTKIPNLPPIKCMSRSRETKMFLDEDGSVWVCGRNPDGRCGAGHRNHVRVPTKISNISEITRISCSNYHLMAVDTNGDVWTCGHNKYGPKKEAVKQPLIRLRWTLRIHL